MTYRGQVGYLRKLGLIAILLTWILAGCNTQTAPNLPAPTDAIGFEFVVDPVQEAVTVNVVTEGAEGLAQQYLPSDTRILVPDVDIALKNYNYVFLRGKRLVIQTRFKNITEDAEFLQPFFFTLNADTDNIKSATAPLVTDRDLGGDGILSPGERTRRLTFEVKHKNKPFRFFVDASAYVREIKPLWPVQFGSGANDNAFGVATDAVGNVYVSGNVGGRLPGNTTGFDDAFIAKYASDATPLWFRQFGSAAGDNARSVATDASGNIYVSGLTRGRLPGNSSAGGVDVLVAKYASDGSQLWLRQFGSDAIDIGFGVATDASGNIYVSGLTWSSLPGNASAGGMDAFVAKYASDGTPLWIKQFGSASGDGAIGVDTDLDGNIYVSGYTDGSLPGNSSAGSDDTFIAKYTPDGTPLWIKQFGGASSDIAQGVATDPGGNVYVSGYTFGSLPGNASAGSIDAFVAKYTSDGSQLWLRQFGSDAIDEAFDLDTDLDGSAYVTGYTLGSLPGNTAVGEEDAFVAKYASDGTPLWLRQFGSANNDIAQSVATDTSGNVYVGGDTFGIFPGNINVGGRDAFVAKYDSSGAPQ